MGWVVQAEGALLVGISRGTGGLLSLPNDVPRLFGGHGHLFDLVSSVLQMLCGRHNQFGSLSPSVACDSLLFQP